MERRNLKDCTELWCTLDWQHADECDIVLHSAGVTVLPIVISYEASTITVFMEDPQSVVIPMPRLGKQTHFAIRFDGPCGVQHTRAITLEIDSEPLASILLTGAFEPIVLTEVTFGEPVVPASFGLWIEQEAIGNFALLLDRHLAMSGVLTARHRPALSLNISGCPDRIPVAAASIDNSAKREQADNAQWQIDAPLPGWIWRTAHSGAETIEMTVMDNDRPLGNISIGRNDVVKIIDEMACQGVPGTASISELCALEHVVYGELINRITPEAKSFVTQIAQTYGVESFLATSSTETSAVSKTPLVPVESEMMTRAIVEGAALVLSPSSDRIAALQGTMRDFGFLGNPERIRDFLLQLTERYILSGNFDNLARLAQLHGGIQIPENADNWAISVSLPYLIRQGNLEQASEAIWSIDPDRDWIVTPAIAHAVSEAMVLQISKPSSVEALSRLTYGYMNLLRKTKVNYWGRAQCSALLECSSNLVQQAVRKSLSFRNDIESFALEVHGLSGEFWDRVARHSEHSLRVATAARYFEHLREAQNNLPLVDKPQVIDALRHFMEYAPADTLRFARELLPQELLADCLSGAISGLRPKLGADLDEFIRVAAHPAFAGKAVPFRNELRQALFSANDCQSLAPDLTRRAARELYCLSETHNKNYSSHDALLREITSLSACGEGAKAAEFMILLTALLTSWGRSEDAARIVSHAQKLVEAANTQSEGGVTPGIKAALQKLECAGETGLRYAAFISQQLPANSLRNHPKESSAPADLVFSTIVTIISCQKYLNERKLLIEEAYASRLEELGIPYLFVVGGDRTRLEGNVLQLDCSDDYEGLPEKILSAVEWVQQNTDHAFMFKIDDDCFLNVDEFFFGHSWRSADYYGRCINRPVGSMDRMWHMPKSSTIRAKLELDKSPEPSVYADGGSGYSLSRRAMEVILDELQTSRGALLRNSCYMEDKLVGDLLAAAGITLSSADYHVSVFRKLPLTSTPVSMYANSFLPSRVWPTKLAHLDHPKLFKTAQEQARTETLWPSKIWPSYSRAQIGGNSNALDLITAPEKAWPILEQPISVVACIRNEMTILPQFLDHYRRLGVASFLFSDNCSTDGSASYLAEQPDVVLFSCDTAYRESNFGVAWQQALLSSFRCGRWSIVADADEFLVPPGADGRLIADFLAEVDSEGANAVLGLLLDMYPAGDLSTCDLSKGSPFQLASYTDQVPLQPVWFHGPYSNSPAWISSVRHRLAPNSSPSDFTAQKVCVLKYAPWMQLSAGLHYVGDCQISETPAVLCHFKYHAKFHAKVIEEVQRKQHFGGASEYIKYLDAMNANSTIYDPSISVPWREAPMVREALTGQLHISWPNTRTRTKRKELPPE